MKGGKRKRCSTSENQEVESLSSGPTTKSDATAGDPNGGGQYYFNQSEAKLERLSSLSMPPPQAPPLTSAIDFINYNTYYQAAISAVAAASSSSHQSYLNYNQFLINNNNTNNSNSALVRPNHNLTNIQASGYLDTHRTGETDTMDKTANNFYSNKASFLTLENLNKNASITSAKKSSYYCLTPASSTTSLNDLNNSTKLLEDFQSANSNFNKSGLTTKSSKLTTQQSLSQINNSVNSNNSKKRTRLSIDTYKCTDLETSATNSVTFMQPSPLQQMTTTATASTATTTNATKTVGPRRGRGRPPKNSTVATSVATFNTIVEEKKQESILNGKESKVLKVAAATTTTPTTNPTTTATTTTITTTKTSNPKSNGTKLIKSLINKSASNSNLQKSKVLQSTNQNLKPTVSISDLGQTNETILSSSNSCLSNQTKSNVALSSSLNSSNQQITGYLVDKVNNNAYLKQQQQNYRHYYNNNSNKTGSDTENNYIICAKSSIYPFITTSSKQEVVCTTTTNNSDTTSKSLILTHVTDDDSTDQSTPMLNLNWASGGDLWRVMRSKELKYAHSHLYLKRHLGIEPQMRAILLDWLVEISYAYRLHRETFHLACEYMDRFMTTCKQQMRVDRLQLIGMSCLFLAAKVEEIYPPKLKEFAGHMENYSANNEDAIQQFELFILKSLNWEISPVTANTWLMTYLQIGSINYYINMRKFANRNQVGVDQVVEKKLVHNSHVVMPLHIYKNSNRNLRDYTKKSAESASNNTETQQEFYLKNYMISVTLLDLCMFDMESLKHSYSELAAAAMYHMVSLLDQEEEQKLQPQQQQANGADQCQSQLKAFLVEQCTGYSMSELDSCIKWMYPYADVCKDVLTCEKMTTIKSFSNVDADDAHNVQLYYHNLDLLKEAHSRKTPSKYYVSSSSSSSSHSQLLLTPPDSHRKSSSSISSNSILSTTSLLSTQALT
jgi:cyclin E